MLIDTDGVGGGVEDQANGYNFIGISAGGEAREPEKFRNVRSELWFSSQSIAKARLMDLSRLPLKVRQEIGRQLVALTYVLDPAGRRVVEPKDATKRRLGKSPDQADALNLAYYLAPAHGERVVGQVK